MWWIVFVEISGGGTSMWSWYSFDLFERAAEECSNNHSSDEVSGEMWRSCGMDITHALVRCPLCNRSTQEDMTPIWNAIDQEIARVRMPKEYRTTFVKIHCNDCE